MRLQKVVLFALVAVFLAAGTVSLYGHCQIPCGIYGDEMRFKMIEEDITTVEKSIKQILELSKASPVNYNQLVRWITNKDEHATKIQDIVNAYFFTQRISPVDPSDKKAYQEYIHKLELLHQLLYYAMKTKQTTDLAHVEKLRTLLQEFYDVYFSPEDKEHLKEHNH
ncbi:MAG: superoxide dismutase [Calditrichaeota bacterium]|nr:superoxide dismutase [Calditrichota bacterium]RQV92873.1 MAG: superoxide dismutase [bacterium]RQW02624.1 MAG: superoxide dismutase [Calditrichota bacterium]